MIFDVTLPQGSAGRFLAAIFIALLMAGFGNALAPPAPANQNALCLYNSNSAVSTQICDYYVSKRPGANKLGIAIPDSHLVENREVTNLDFFIKDVVAPFRKHINDNPSLKITHVAIAKDVPYKISAAYQTDFPTSLILSLDTDYGKYFNPAENTQEYSTFFSKIPPINNAYRGIKLHFNPDDYSDPGKSNYKYAVTYLTAYKLEDVLHMIDRATGPAPNLAGTKWVLDTYEQSGPSDSIWNELAGARDSLASTPVNQGNIILETTSAKPLAVGGEISGYAGRGHYHPGYTNKWAAAIPAVLAKVSNRAIMTTIESFNATTFTGNPEHSVDMANELQSKIADAMSANTFGGSNYSSSFAGAVGNVSEPNVPGINNIADFFSGYAVGMTFGESFLSSVAKETANLAIGDPLMRINQTDKLANGNVCADDSECIFGNCDPDIFGTKRCHSNAASCVDFEVNKTGLPPGEYLRTFREIGNTNSTCLFGDKTPIYQCENGTWKAPATCPGQNTCNSYLATPAVASSRTAACKLADGLLCTSDIECHTGKCSADTAGQKRCHSSNSCMVDSTQTAPNNSFRCTDDKHKAQCIAPQWQAPVECGGTCGQGVCSEGIGTGQIILTGGNDYYYTLPVEPVSRKIDDLFPNANGAQLFVYRNSSGTKKFITATFDDLEGKWFPAGTVNDLAMGEGFSLRLSTDYAIIFNGTELSSPVGAKISGKESLVGFPFCGNKYNAAGMLKELSGRDATCKTMAKGNFSKWWSTDPSFTNLRGTKENFALGNYDAYWVLCGAAANFDFTPSCSPPNTPPTLTLKVTSLANPPQFIAPAVIRIEASASDAGGVPSVVATLQRDGFAALDRCSGSPSCSADVGPLAAGGWTATAKATDSGTPALVDIKSVRITVNPNPAANPTTVSITSPANSAVFTLGEGATAMAIPIQATAADNDGIKEVEFFAGTTSLGVDSAAPYAVAWNATAGIHTLKAVAKDNLNAQTPSATMQVTVNPSGGVVIVPPGGGSGTGGVGGTETVFIRAPNTTSGNLVAITKMSLEPAKTYYYPHESLTVNLSVWKKNTAAPGNAPEYKITKVQAWLRTVYGDEYGHIEVNNAENKQEVEIILGGSGSPKIELKNVRPGNYLVVAQVEQLDGTPDPSRPDNIASIYITVAEKRFTVPEIPFPLAALLGIAVIFVVSRAGRKRA